MPPKRKLDSSEGPRKSQKKSENSTIDSARKKRADVAALEAQEFLKGFSEKRSRRAERSTSEKLRIKKIKVKPATKKAATGKKKGKEGSTESSEDSV